jgi:large subunit ribosomal protein L21
MAYAVIKTGGKQYRVQDGDVLEIEKLDLEPGAETTFEEVLLVGEGEDVKVGTPLVAGAAVSAKVVDQHKGDKVVAYKFKRRKGYHRTVGHRQLLTQVKITGITA